MKTNTRFKHSVKARAVQQLALRRGTDQARNHAAEQQRTVHAAVLRRLESYLPGKTFNLQLSKTGTNLAGSVRSAR